MDVRDTVKVIEIIPADDYSGTPGDISRDQRWERETLKDFVGQQGRIIHLNPKFDTPYAVAFSRYTKHGHSLSNRVPNGYGMWFKDGELRRVDVKKPLAQATVAGKVQP